MSINFGTQKSEYPNGIDSTYTQNFIKTAQILASSNHGTYITSENHLPRQDLTTYDQVNNFFHEGLKGFSVEELYNDFFPILFPLTEAGPKTETTTLININKFSATPTSKVGQKYFTTQYNETFLNTKDLYGSGFQVTTDFVNTDMGNAMFRMFIQTCIDSLRLSLKQKIYHEGVCKISDPYMDSMLKIHAGNLEDFIDVMNSRKKMFFNIIGKRPDRCLEAIEEKMLEDQNKNGLPKLDSIIFHPSVDVVRKLDVNWRNDSKGQFDNINGPQNKIHAHERVFELGKSAVYYQEMIEIAKGHFYDPFANIGVCGEHFLMPNECHSYPETHSEQKRSIKIWDEDTNMHELISYTDVMVHTAELYNSIQTLDNTNITFAQVFGATGTILKVSDVLKMNQDGKLKTPLKDIKDFCHKRFQCFIASQLDDAVEKSFITRYTDMKQDTSDTGVYDTFEGLLKNPNTAEEKSDKIKTLLAFTHFFALQYSKVKVILKTKFGIGDTQVISFKNLYNDCLKNEKYTSITKTGTLSIDILDIGGKSSLTDDVETVGLNYFEKMCHYIFLSIVLGENDQLNVTTARLLAKNAIEVGWNVMVVRRKMVYKTGGGCGLLSGGGSFKRGTNKITPKVVIDEENAEYRMGVTQYQQARLINPKALYRIQNIAPIAHLVGGSTKWAKNHNELMKIHKPASAEAQTFDIYGMFVPMNSKFNHYIIHTSEDTLGAAKQLSKLIGDGLFNVYKKIVPTQSSKEDFVDHFDNIQILPSETSKTQLAKKRIFSNCITDPGAYMRLDHRDTEEIFPGDACWQYISNKDAKKRFLSQNY